MNSKRFGQIVFMLLMLLVSGAEVTLAADVTADDIKINYTNPSKGTLSASVGALGSPTAGCYRVTLTATPASAYYGITTSNIIVQPLVDPASTRSNNPGIANNLTVSGSGNTFYFDLPQRYHGALVTATFTEKSLTEIEILDEITAQDGCYKVKDGLTSISGTPGVTEFKGVLDGNFVPFSCGSLFEKVNGAIIKNVIISSASVSGGTNAGAIANEATGASRIYNCGVNGGSVSGDDYVGSIVGLLDGSARVINCYSYADIEGGTDRGGIVGYNAYASKSGDIRTMVMNCLFLGSITTGGNVSPVYGGLNIDNVKGATDTGLNTYNYYRYATNKNITTGKYNCALAVKDLHLTRFEIYRELLNSNRKLAAWYATGDATKGVGENNEMAKWVLDKTVKPYPILKAQGKYTSIVNYDANSAPETPETTKTLSVTLTGTGITTTSLSLPITDKDPDNYNYNYHKVQLPYFNDVGTGNYTDNKVVTGWKITSISGGSNSYSTGDDVTFNTDGSVNKTPYNFADRNCTDKDNYSVSGRVFSQGAYWDVPYGVDAITIEPYWGKAAYICDPNLDVVYSTDYNSSGNVTDMGEQGNSLLASGQTIHTSLSSALGTFTGVSKPQVYDYALVLVGNLHLNSVPSAGNTPFTIMSVDLDHDNEPDYSLIYNHNNRQSVSPIRFDFLNIPGTAMAQKPNGATQLRNFSIFKPKGWFEITNTTQVSIVQFEYDNGSKNAAPLILLGGEFEQFVSTQNSAPSVTQYIHVGSNAYFKEFNNGTHSDGFSATKHIPISATGGEYDKFYLSGAYRPDAAVAADNAEGYISGGKFGEVAGAGQQMIDGHVYWQIYNADITEFYGGGINSEKPVTGNIIVDIFNSNVTTYCGGPKFGDMQKASDSPITITYATNKDATETSSREATIDSDRTVTTNATGCTFGNYYGAGYGGIAYLRGRTRDSNVNVNFSSWQADYTNNKGKYFTGKGVATDFDYEFFVWSTGATGGRFYVNYASLSLAETNDVSSTLNGCTITGNFYGGGCLGKVTGDVTSTLTNCTIAGSVYGAGYSASKPTVPYRNGGFTTAPKIDTDAGIFADGVKTTSIINLALVSGSLSNETLAISEGSKTINTNVSLDNLGTVEGKVTLNINAGTSITGNVYGGGALSDATGDVEINVNGGSMTDVFGGGQGQTTVVSGDVLVNIGAKNTSTGALTGAGSISGNVYGGSALGAVNATKAPSTGELSLTSGKETTVNIYAGNVTGSVFGGGLGQITPSEIAAQNFGDATVTMEGGTVSTGVYGGANTNGVLKKKSIVTITGGVVGTAVESGDPNDVVFGGGKGQPTLVEGDVEVNIGESGQTTGGATINGSVYGGSAMGNVNAKKEGDNTVYSGTSTNPKTTSVTLNKGTVNGDIYGGGLGDNTSGSEVAANVYGPVTVTVEGGKAQNVFGCNNKYGTPKSTVVVLINGTAATVENEGVKTYALQGVYGGGNLAHYDPTTPSTYPTVTVNGCSTSIKDVFGGGNAAAVPYTNVTINGGDIDRVFAGGNGESGTPANIGYKNSDENPSSGSYGAGTTSALIKGGTINKIFGGSNSKGTVRESGGTLSIEKPATGTDLCEMHIGEVYGGGNLASGAACNILVGCTGGESEGIEYLYGGANDADVSGDITLNITDGRIQNVFGGNNTGHAVNGTITVNINQKANPCGWNIGNVYGGGNQAVYTAPTATEQNATAHNYPQVNIINGTVSGDVFGGGYGDADDATKGVVNGNPQVTINGASAVVNGGVYGGGSLAPTNGNPFVTLTTGSAANIYGGGMAASVNGAPTVNVNGGSVSTGVYGGCNTSGTVSGNISVSITNGAIGAAAQGTQGQEGYVAETRANVHGGGYGASTATNGNVVVTINGASANIYGDVYGGSALGSVNDAAEDATTVTLTAGTIHGNIYGGGLGESGEDNVAKGQVNGAVTVTVNGGTVTDVFGCNNTNGSPKSTVTVNINNSVSGNVYGGGKDAAYSPTTAAAYPVVYINNGTIGANVYGGGKGSTATVTSNPVVTIGDATDEHAAIVTGDVYGGGDAAAVTGNTTVTYNDNNTSSTVARLFGGGNAAGVSGTSTVTMTLGKVTGGVYGGCNSDGSVGAVTIALNGGQVGTDATHRADVYGGGLGNSTTTTGNIDITLGTDATTGTTVYGDIYGGSALGNVNVSASNTTTVTLTSATLYGSVFGGGKGDNASEGDGHSDVTATSNGGATVNINVANTHLTGIYGGANIRGNVKGAIAVNINANVGASGSTLDIFGGGYGANTNTEDNVTVTIGDAAGTYQPVIYGDIYGGSALGNVNNEASDITTVDFLNGTLHGDLYGGGLGNADNAAKVYGKVIVNISNEDQLATNCHIDLRETSIYGCNNANGSPQDDVTVNIYKTDHTSDNGISGTSYAIDQVFGGGDQADYAPENGLATSTKKATVNIIGCNNTIRRVFGGGNAAAAVGVVTRIDGGHFDYVYGGGNGEVTAANIGAGGTNLQIHGGEINNLFGGSNAQGTITGNMGVTVDNDCDCGQSGGTAQYVNEFFCGNNLASIGTPENPVTINAKIACGTKFGAVYGGCNLAPLYGSVNLTVEGGVMDYVYGGSKGDLASLNGPGETSHTDNPANISGDVTLTIKGGQIKNVFGGSNINGNIAGIITVNIERVDATPACADGWYVGNVYGGSNLAAYTPTTPGAYPAVNIKNGTVNGNVYGGGKGTTATVTSNPAVTIGDVTNENYAAIVADDENDKDVNNDAFVGGNVYGGGDAAPVVGSTTVTYNDNSTTTSVANIYGGGNNASVSGNATVTLKGNATVEHDVFGGGNNGIVGGTAKVNIEE